MPRDIEPVRLGRIVENRSPLHRAAKDCLAELFRENGGHKCVIDRFGFSLQRAYRITGHNHDDSLSIWRAAALSSPKATAVARWFATLCGGVFVPMAVRAGDALALVAASARANGNAVAEAIEALADKVVTPREAAAVVKSIDAAIADLASLRASVAAMVEGGR